MNHAITVTPGGPFGRAWFDCTCGASRRCASHKSANAVALAHHRDVVGCTCRPEAYDPECVKRTTNPDITVPKPRRSA